MKLFVCANSIDIMLFRYPQKRHKEPLVSFSIFNFSMESAIEQRIVVSLFILMKPKPQHLFSRSTSIRSVLSLFTVLCWFFLRSPQCRTKYVNTFTFAKIPIVPVAVYLIDQFTYGISLSM